VPLWPRKKWRGSEIQNIYRGNLPYDFGTLFDLEEERDGRSSSRSKADSSRNMLENNSLCCKRG
jgi:hypothetical protein